MTQTWRQFQGQVVEGKFPLTQYLGGSDHSAVFLTERPQGEPRKTAIKLIAADPRKAERQLSRWAEAAELSHPRLLRLFERGRCRLGNTDLLYVVMEFAEEDLSQVVTARALTPDECRDMLPAVLDALAYIHRQGFVHGHLKPANIMAAREQIKLSCDGLGRTGESSAELGAASVYDPPEAGTEGLSAAADVWSLGMLLVEVLTQKLPVLEAGRKETLLPAVVPRPLFEVVRHCLRLDRARRWTVDEIAARLSPAPALLPTPPSLALEETPATPRYLFVLAAVAVIVVAVVAGARLSRHGKVVAPSAPAVVAKAAKPAPPAVAAKRVAAKASAPKASSSPVPAPAGDARSTADSAAPPAVLRPVLPRVPQSALDTITGTVRVRVRVAVDQDGNVADARFDSMGPSKYFARLSLEAAHRWKFTPPQPDGGHAGREWLLRFEFRHDSTHAFSTPLSR